MGAIALRTKKSPKCLDLTVLTKMLNALQTKPSRASLTRADCIWRWYPAGANIGAEKYRFAGKEKRLALGTYPLVTLAIARGFRNDARF